MPFQFLVVPYFLAALLGVKLGKGWLVRRPALSWSIVGLGVAGVAGMAWAGVRTPALLTLTLIPLLACLAAGVAVARTNLPGFWRILILILATLLVSGLCAISIPWDV